MRNYAESHTQEQLVLWLRYEYPKLFFTGGFAGEKMGIRQAMRRKRMGYRAGTPDLLILEPGGIYHGLMLEMKAPKGTISDSQRDFGERATANGYAYAVCRGLEEAQQKVEEYLGMKEKL